MLKLFDKKKILALSKDKDKWVPACQSIMLTIVHGALQGWAISYWGKGCQNGLWYGLATVCERGSEQDSNLVLVCCDVEVLHEQRSRCLRIWSDGVSEDDTFCSFHGKFWLRICSRRYAMMYTPVFQEGGKCWWNKLWSSVIGNFFWYSVRRRRCWMSDFVLIGKW